jgi:hypothetical protein
MTDFTPCEIIYAVEDPATGSSGDQVTLEQAEIDSSALSLKDWIKENGLGWSLETIADYFDQRNSICAADGHIDLTIYAYPSRPDLVYKISASYGELTGGGRQSTNRIDRENIALQASYTMEATPTGEVSASWDGVVYNEDGLEVTPLIQINGNVVTWGGIKVLGTLVLQYGLDRDVYILTLFPRDASETDQDRDADAYAATVTAFWAGGYTQLDADIPDLDSYCRQTGSNVSVDPDDDDGDGERCYRRRLLVYSCTSEIISDTIEEISCPGD